jgi:hypothetical protein
MFNAGFGLPAQTIWIKFHPETSEFTIGERGDITSRELADVEFVPRFGANSLSGGPKVTAVAETLFLGLNVHAVSPRTTTQIWGVTLHRA